MLIYIDPPNPPIYAYIIWQSHGGAGYIFLVFRVIPSFPAKSSQSEDGPAFLLELGGPAGFLRCSCPIQSKNAPRDLDEEGDTVT